MTAMDTLSPGNLCGQLRTLPSRGIGRKPSKPLLRSCRRSLPRLPRLTATLTILSRELPAASLEDCHDVCQTLTSLLLNRCAFDPPVGGIVWGCAGNEDESSRLDRRSWTSQEVWQPLVCRRSGEASCLPGVKAKNRIPAESTAVTFALTCDGAFLLRARRRQLQRVVRQRALSLGEPPWPCRTGSSSTGAPSSSMNATRTPTDGWSGRSESPDLLGLRPNRRRQRRCAERF